MGCRGAIHCAHLGSRGIPLGAMNCAPTPCAYLKGIVPCGRPLEGLKLTPMGAILCGRPGRAYSDGGVVMRLLNFLYGLLCGIMKRRKMRRFCRIFYLIKE